VGRRRGAAVPDHHRRATSHWIRLDYLPGFGAVPVAERVVIDGKYATAPAAMVGALRASDLVVGAI
jgi:hypothetical protein